MLTLESVTKRFGVRRRWGRSPAAGDIAAVDGVTLEISKGEVFGLAGESGSGKSTLTRLILKLLSPTSGAIRFDNRDIAGLRGPELPAYRRAVQVVFQDPNSSLNPRMRVDAIIEEPLRYLTSMGHQLRRRRVAESLESVGLGPRDGERYPGSFSGGQRQRIAIARALCVEPRLILLDEPVSSLDVSIQAKILNLLKDIHARAGTAFLLVSHDLSVLRYLCHRIGVMKDGRIVEEGPAARVFSAPSHPYTTKLVASVSSAAGSNHMEGDV